MRPRKDAIKPVPDVIEDLLPPTMSGGTRRCNKERLLTILDNSLCKEGEVEKRL